MKPNKNVTLKLLRDSKKKLQREYPLRGIALYGSVARGNATSESDIDIMVDVEPTIGLRFVTLADQLEALLGHKVDLVSKRAIKPALMKHIQVDLIDV